MKIKLFIKKKSSSCPLLSDSNVHFNSKLIQDLHHHHLLESLSFLLKSKKKKIVYIFLFKKSTIELTISKK